jgi:hypothetical protein
MTVFLLPYYRMVHPGLAKMEIRRLRVSVEGRVEPWCWRLQVRIAWEQILRGGSTLISYQDPYR